MVDDKIKDVIEKEIDNKLTKVDENVQALSTLVPQEINKYCKSFAEVAAANIPKKTEEKQQLQIKNTVLEAISEHQEQSRNESKLMEERKKNIIVFNAPESKDKDGKTRKEHDTTLFVNIYRKVCAEGLERESLLQVRRLGAMAENKNRPLLVAVSSEEQKRKLFKCLYRLKDIDMFTNISMSHDMTKEERALTKSKVAEANSKTAQMIENDKEKSKNWIFRVRGPPWQQKVVLVKRHQPLM